MKREIRQQIDCASKLIRAFRHTYRYLPAGEPHAVEDNGYDFRIEALDLETQLIDIADGRIIVHRTDIHAFIQSEISMKSFS